jgi:TP901 family phage tail tape measure protein
MVSYVSIFRAVADFQGAARQGQQLGKAFRDARREAELAGRAGTAMGGSFQRGARAAAMVADRTGRALTLGISVPVVALGGLAIHTFATFERAIVSAGSKSSATAAQLDEMKKVAIDVGLKTRYSAVQAANAMDNLAAAGFNAKDAMATLPAVTDAAQASNEDLALTADTVARTMNAWGIPVSKAGHVADVLSTAANTTALTMNGLADAIGQAGEVGPRFNQSLEDVIATIGRLVDMGVPAASAGTAVRQALTSLSAPNSARAARMMDSLGIATRDANSQMLPLPKLIKNVREGLSASNPAMAQYRKLIGMTDDQLKDWAKSQHITFASAVQLRSAISKGGTAFADYATRIMFGVEGAKAFSLAMSDNHPLLIDVNTETDKMRRLTDGLTISLGSRGAAQAFIQAHTAAGQFKATSADAVTAISALEVASNGVSKAIGAAFQQTTAQKIDNLKSSVETLAIVLVQDLKPDVDGVVGSLNSFVQGFTGFAQAHSTLTKVGLGFVAIAAAAGPALFVVGQLITAFLTVSGAATRVAGAARNGAIMLQLYAEQAQKGTGRIGSFSRGLGAAASFMTGPWGIAIGIGITVLGAWALKQKEASDKAKAFMQTLTFVNGALDENSRSLFAHQLANDGVFKSVLQAGISEKAFTDALVSGGPARQAMIDQLMAIAKQHTGVKILAHGTAPELDSVGKAALAAADALRINGARLDEQAEATRQADNAQGHAASTTDRVTTATKGMSLAQWEAKNRVKDMAKVQRDLEIASHDLAVQVDAVVRGFTLLRDGALDASTADDAFSKSLVEAREGLTKGKDAFSKNTSAGLANRDLVKNMIRTLNDKATADFKHAYSTSKATTEEGKLSDALKVAQRDLDVGKRKMLESAGGSDVAKKHVRDMQGQYLKTPKELRTDVKTPGIDAATRKVHNLRVEQEKFKRHIAELDIKFRMAATKAAVNVFKNMPGSQASGLVGLRPGFAGGGQIGGSSPNKHADNIPLMGTAREWMQPVESVDYYGPQVMSDIQHRRIPREAVQHLAKGGPVVRNELDVPGRLTLPRRRPNTATVPPATLSFAADQARTSVAAAMRAQVSKINASLNSGLANTAMVRKALNAVGQHYAIGMCLQFVRTLLGAPGGEYDAATGWRDTRYKHPGDHHPPGGAPVWWGGGHGHVAIAVGGNKIVSTDLPTMGRVGLVPLSEPSTRWGKPYLGWSGDLNGKVFQFGPSRTGSAADSAGARSVAHALLQIRGWNDQFQALDYVIQHESGWNVHARNPSSGAYGLGQALPGSKMAPFGADWRDSPNTQLRWMLDYIGSRYGDPRGAQRFWRAHHWYDTGGRMPPGGVAHNGTKRPETVLDPKDSQTFDQLVAALSGRGPSMLGKLLATSPAMLSRAALVNANATSSESTTFNMPIYYPRDTEVTTLATQRQLVRAGRKRFR